MSANTNFPANQLLTEREVASLLKLKIQTLRNWRCMGRGPKYIKLCGHAVRYPAHEIENFVIDQPGMAE